MIGRFDCVLWDVDGTLVDFAASETMALRLCFEARGIHPTEEQILLYKRINRAYWDRLERGEVSRSELYSGRFRDWFDAIGVKGIDAVKMNEDFQIALGDNPVPFPGAMETLRSLQSVCRQYIVSNGSTVAQRRKLKYTGIDAIVDGIFISEAVGTPKPDTAFFDACANAIPDYRAERTVIIGDSLTSDMRGGNNAGIACVWFNPSGQPNMDGIRVDAEARSLTEIPEILRRL